MRISTNQMYSTGLGMMQDVQSSLNGVQKQVSSGVKLSSPADDPIAFSQSLKLSEELSINGQFKQNILAAVGKSELSDSMMNSALTNLQRMRELALQASNDTLNQADRQGIADEVRILQSELAGIMNAKDGSGAYLFGGFQGRGQPFVERSGGGYDYNGDEGRRLSQISSSSYVDVSDSGRSLFVDIPAARNTILTRVGSNNDPDGGGTISVGQVYDQLALDAVFPEKYTITFGDPAENQNRQTFTVRRVSDGSPVIGSAPVGSLENVTFIPGETIDFNGIRLKISGNPQAGDVFFCDSCGNQSVMNTVERFALALEDLSVNPVVIEGTSSLIGRAAPPRPTLTSAGNYVAEQVLTLKGDDGTLQAVNVLSNQDVGTVAANLDALTGISASFDEAEAVLDFTTTNADEGDIIQFNLNGVAVQATAGATASDTFANIDAVLGGLLPVGGLSYVNEGSGRFRVTENTGEDVAVDSFQVVDFPGVELNITSGLSAGETISFTMAGSAGETVNVSYTAVTGDIDELATQTQAAITAAGFGGVMSVGQAAPGQPAQIRYSGDTDGNAQIVLSNLTDNASDDIVLGVTPLEGTLTTDSLTNGVASNLRAGATVNVSAQEGRSSMGFGGVIGTPVTLQDGGNDSSAVAARLNYTVDAGYELTSNVLDRNGGLVSDPSLEDTVSMQFRAAMNASIEDIDTALNNITRARSNMGARLTLLETSRDLNEGLSLELEDFLSQVRDLDYAEALTAVEMKTFVLEASQNTFVRMTSLSLFNFI